MDADIVELAGFLFAAWASGYGIGITICYFRKFAEKI